MVYSKDSERLQVSWALTLKPLGDGGISYYPSQDKASLQSFTALLKLMRLLSMSRLRGSVNWIGQHVSVELKAMIYAKSLSLILSCKGTPEKSWRRSLAPVLTPESVLCTDGNLSYQTIVKNLPFELDS